MLADGGSAVHFYDMHHISFDLDSIDIFITMLDLSMKNALKRAKTTLFFYFMFG